MGAIAVAAHGSLTLVGDENDDDLLPSLEAAHLAMCRAEYRMLLMAARVEARESWRDEGARDGAHWLAMHYGISEWKARRWIAAGKALPTLPSIASAFVSGHIGVDKVLELVRFATPDTERGLLTWAQGVNASTVRRRADLALRTSIEEERSAHTGRFANWWWTDEGRRFGLEAEFPAAQGIAISQALTRIVARVPVLPGEEGASFSDARKADALFALASVGVAEDPDPDRATVVIHAELAALRDETSGVEVQDGPVLHARTAQRLACNARLQTIVEAPDGQVAYVGQMRRQPSAWMLRQVRYRDKGCVFPGCGTKAFTEAHHIRFWRHGGATELANLALICSFHHRLVHEDGWSISRDPDQRITWRRPNGQAFGSRVGSAGVALADTS